MYMMYKRHTASSSEMACGLPVLIHVSPHLGVGVDFRVLQHTKEKQLTKGTKGR
jgi:hypothetical protein